jgi:hypothetical protein
MKYSSKFLVFVLIIPLLFTAAGSAAEPAKKVAILPFEINAPEDLSYLREGIMDMLASRISWEGKVEAIEEQLVKSALALITSFLAASRCSAKASVSMPR